MKINKKICYPTFIVAVQMTIGY